MLLDSRVARKLRDQISHGLYAIKGITLVYDGKHRGAGEGRTGTYRFEFDVDRIYPILSEEVRPVCKQGILVTVERLAIARTVRWERRNQISTFRHSPSKPVSIR